MRIPNKYIFLPFKFNRKEARNIEILLVLDDAQTEIRDFQDHICNSQWVESFKEDFCDVSIRVNLYYGFGFTALLKFKTYISPFSFVKKRKFNMCNKSTLCGNINKVPSHTTRWH